MSTSKVQIVGEMIVLRKASDKTRSELAFNRFINILKSLVVLDKDIEKIEINELIDTAEVKDKTKRVIKEFRIEKKKN